MEDANYARMVQCINPALRVLSKVGNQDENMDALPGKSGITKKRGVTLSTHCHGNNDSSEDNNDSSEDDNDAARTPFAFQAGMPSLGTLTTLAICSMELTLELVSLQLHLTSVENTIRANMLNAHQILISCKALRYFAIEYLDMYNTFEIMASTTTTCLLFDNLWVCSRLETLNLNGIKRQIAVDNNDKHSVHGRCLPTSTAKTRYMLIKLQDLLGLAGLTASTPQIASIINMGYRPSLLKEMDELQEKMFGQLARLKQMTQLTFNGSTFRDFFKLAYY
ncbi:hypothetical protein EDD11_000741 [Mortierella claussenii]|nr:hypothetical protein EDD11_000741 [Mortierella claussenii]